MNNYETYKKIISRTDIVLSVNDRERLINEIKIHEDKVKELEKIFPKGQAVELHYEWQGKFKAATVDHVEIDDAKCNRIYFVYDDDEEKEVRWCWWNETGIGITGMWIEICRL